MPAAAISTPDRPWVVVFTHFPSPYQVDLFNQLNGSDQLLLTVVYESSVSSHRLWENAQLTHSHMFLTDSDAFDTRHLVGHADLIVFSGYRNAKVRALMAAREATGRPWVFWGERMGLILPLWLGAFLRQWGLRILHRSRAGMWGIGTLAIKQFAGEFGAGRALANVPYTSDLSGYLAIRREIAPRGPLRILFCGSLIRRKGFDVLLDAFERLLENGVDARLVVVGRGPLESDTAKFMTRHRDRVECLGFVQPPNLPAVYAGCDVLCAPSRHDGWGLIVVEGLAAGMPVISTPSTGAAVDLLDDDCGWLVPAGDRSALYDALKAAADTPPQKLLAMGAAGRERARAYDRAPGAARFIEASRQALGLMP